MLHTGMAQDPTSPCLVTQRVLVLCICMPLLKPFVHWGTPAGDRVIVSEQGVRGLYKGLTPNLLRATLVNIGELSAYDSAKQV